MRNTFVSALALVAAFASLPAAAQIKAGPYVPTPSVIVDEMLKLGDIRRDDYVVDLGSGDGRIVITAAERYGARGLGVDIDPALVDLANENARRAGVADRVRFEKQDLFATSLADATVVTIYLLPHTVTQLVEKLRGEMPPGARVLSHDYALAPWPEDRVIRMDVPEKVAISGTTRTLLYLYTVPARIGGEWSLELPAGLARTPVRIAAKDLPFRVTATATAGKNQVPLDDLSLHGKDIAFTLRARGADRLRLVGRVDGDTMQGTIEGRPGATWRATRVAKP
jgi:SAM-dependent methyltransferase